MRKSMLSKVNSTAWCEIDSYQSEAKVKYLKEPVTPLVPLKYPIYFVSKELQRFSGLIQDSCIIAEPEEVFKRCSSGSDIWTVQSYVNLKRRGLDVRLTDHFIPGEICLSPYNYLKIKEFPYQSFTVATRTDSARPAICEVQSVMNDLAIQSSRDHFLTHWPQPIIAPRDDSRGSTIENIDFKGHPRNIISSFKSPEFQRSLKKAGMQFLFDEDEFNQHETDGTQYQLWTDYSKSDVLIAVRNLTEYDFSLKPALKLINAWHARVPAILGPEPAYQALRQSELDYIEASTAEEALEAVLKLKSDPDLYQAMVKNGVDRAKAFTTDRVASEWREFLNSVVIPEYEIWRQQGFLEKTCVRPARFLLRCIKHRQQLRHHLYHRDNGPRPVQG